MTFYATVEIRVLVHEETEDDARLRLAIALASIDADENVEVTGVDVVAITK